MYGCIRKPNPLRAEPFEPTIPASAGLKVVEAVAEEAGLLSGPVHHLATDKNWVSTGRGGPWSPRFAALFKKAGLTLKDAINKVVVRGHFGPHPEAYHEAIYDRLYEAMRGRSGEALVNAFKSEMQAIGKEATTIGSPLNKLLTGL